VLERRRVYPDVGAAIVFVWGGPATGLRTEERRFVEKLDGRVVVMLGMTDDAVSVSELGGRACQESA
jgi:hypothetical protein